MTEKTSGQLIIQSGNSKDPQVLVEVTPEKAGWDTINFQARTLQAGGEWAFSTGDCELAIVVLSGAVDVQSNRGQWSRVGQRDSVFGGLPYALYLPVNTSFTVKAVNSCEFGVTWAKADKEYPARLVRPSDIMVEIRGGDNATRQINSIIPPGFGCDRLVVVEVYTPGGNWSSYPPHKHDVVKTVQDGQVQEADLDEIYYYKIDRPEGYALQRVYTDPESPLHKAGHPIDAALVVRNNDVVLVPEGYHPVTSPPGYTTYYLNVLVGSAQSLAATDDPQFSWVKSSYKGRDPRIPLYDISQAKGTFIG